MKKKGLIIALVVLIVGACGYFVITNNNNKSNNDSCVNCVVEPATNTTSVKKAKNFNIVYSGETKQYNAYDFIIEKMSQAQYWTYEQHEPVYNFTYENYEDRYDRFMNSKPTKVHNITNGTGFILYDEDTASFVRGFEGRLIINFAENKAISDEWFNPNPNDENDVRDILDKDLDLYYAKVYDYNVNESDELDEFKLVYDSYNEIKRTLEFYNNVFDELDISLVNMPKGTLKSYKSKTIDVPVELIELKYTDRWCDDLIHSPFDERVGFNWCWEEDTDNVWLDDYKDVFNKQSPQTNSDSFIPNLTTGASCAYYAPIFLAFENTKWSNYYLNELKTISTENTYENFSGAYLTYYLKPLYEYAFGFNGVYLYDQTKPLGIIDKDKDLIFGDSFFGDDIQYLYKQEGIGFVVPIYIEGDEKIGNQYQLTGYSFNVDGFNTYLNRVIDKNNCNSCFGNDYCTNLYMLYSTLMQKDLGIR